MELTIGKLNMNIKWQKEKKNSIKAEYRFTEYGNNYYDILLDGEVVRKNVIEWDVPEIIDWYTTRYDIRYKSW